MTHKNPQEPFTLSSFRDLDYEERTRLMTERYTYDGFQFQRDMWRLENRQWRLIFKPEDSVRNALLQCLYRDETGAVVQLEVLEVADDTEPVCILDDIPDAVHAFGRANVKPGQEYLGFTSTIHHNAGPFFVLAYHYRLMKRGWFPDGKQMPEFCPHVKVGPYTFSVVSDDDEN